MLSSHALVLSLLAVKVRRHAIFIPRTASFPNIPPFLACERKGGGGGSSLLVMALPELASLSN